MDAEKKRQKQAEERTPTLRSSHRGPGVEHSGSGGGGGRRRGGGGGGGPDWEGGLGPAYGRDHHPGALDRHHGPRGGPHPAVVLKQSGGTWGFRGQVLDML